MKPRSKFYHLPPIWGGAHGALTEHLLSYLARLSALNRVHPLSVIRGKYKSNDAADSEIVARAQSKGLDRFEGARFIATPSGEHLSEYLAALTCDPKIKKLPLCSRYGDTSTRNSFRKNPAVCPLCVSGDDIPYGRVAWTLADYTVCFKHKVYLVDTCAQCGCKTKYTISGESMDQCFRCGAEMESSIRPSCVSRGELCRSIAVLRFYDELVDGGISLSSKLITSSLMKCAEAHGCSSVKKVAHFYGRSPAAVSQWLNGANRVSVSTYLAICFGAGFDPLNLLVGKYARNSAAHLLRAGFSVKCARPRRDSLDEVRARLEEAARTFPGLSVAGLAKKLGEDRWTLRRAAPELYAEIVIRRKEVQAGSKKFRLEGQRSTILKAVKYLVANGMPVNHGRLTSRLKQSGIMRDPANRKYFGDLKRRYT